MELVEVKLLDDAVAIDMGWDSMQHMIDEHKDAENFAGMLTWIDSFRRVSKKKLETDFTEKREKVFQTIRGCLFIEEQTIYVAADGKMYVDFSLMC